jgi:hypothetical protein
MPRQTTILPSDRLTPSTVRSPWRRYGFPLLPVAFLAVAIGTSVVRDANHYSRTPSTNTDETAETGVDDKTHITLQFHDTELPIALGPGGVKPTGAVEGQSRPAIWEPSMRFGLEAHGPDGRKRLTFETAGLTNNACVHLDGNEWLFGERPFRLENGQPVGWWPGRWENRDEPLGKGRDGRRSTWVYAAQNVAIVQTAEVILGPQGGRKDTCLVRYKLVNRGREPHIVGLRFLLDTFIGSNDGVPFLIPGERELCSTSRTFGRPDDIPDFIQACEFDDLRKPGTVAQLQLRIGGGLEAPSRVTLGAWPNLELNPIDKRCLQEKTLWDVPVLPIHSIRGGDSAVTIYWEPKNSNLVSRARSVSVTDWAASPAGKAAVG